MILSQRIIALTELGKMLENLSTEELNEWADRAGNENRWFTPEAVEMAIAGIVKMLEKTSLEKWLSNYTFSDTNKQIGIVMAGNIPMVGFHDLLSVLISGNTACIKLSSQDKVLMPLVTNLLIAIEPSFELQVRYVIKLENTDAVIATGSDNSARYFKQYFGKQPNIIRKNRISCAVLMGNESNEEIIALGQDIFAYFGLGCRNVSKLFVPKGYDFVPFLSLLEQFKEIGNHSKWVNNYDYNKSIYLVNREPHLDNGFLLLRESTEMVSPLSVLYYQEYSDSTNLKSLLTRNAEKIQCIVGRSDETNSVPFGDAQYPEVWDYADGVDTLQFLERM
jgi:acyl-CoA reductase LuxC